SRTARVPPACAPEPREKSSLLLASVLLSSFKACPRGAAVPSVIQRRPPLAYRAGGPDSALRLRSTPEATWLTASCGRRVDTRSSFVTGNVPENTRFTL